MMRNTAAQVRVEIAVREQTAKLSAALAQLAPGAPPPESHSSASVETVSQYAKRHFDDRERRGYANVSTERGHFRNHVERFVGDLPITGDVREALRSVVEELDEKARQKVIDWQTAIKIWGTTTKMFSDACESKIKALRVRTDNPCAGLRGPDRGERKPKQWLYPTEVTTLLRCEQVPLRWRRLYALMAYLYLRPGELAALEWADVLTRQDYVSIHQTLDLETGEVEATKTGITRKVPIPAALVPLLDVMRVESRGAGRVVQNNHANKKADHGFPPQEDLAANLREHLRRAGVDRADLFADRGTTKRITFYDLRATGITWEALAGTEPLKIKQRAGHKNFSTTEVYIREAEAVGLAVGQPFPPLPPCMLKGAGSGGTPAGGPGGAGSNGEGSGSGSQGAASHLRIPLGTPSVISAHLRQHVERLSEIKTHGCPIEARVTNQPFQKIALLRGRASFE